MRRVEVSMLWVRWAWLIGCMLIVLQPAHGADVFGRSTEDSPAIEQRQAWPVPPLLRELLVKGVRIQSELNARLADKLEEVRDGTNPQAWWIIVLAAFAYGVLHALGPGHGKFVVGIYLASHRARILHAVCLSVWAALAQALTAIVLVLALGAFFRHGLGTVLTRAVDLELASYLALAAVAGWTLWSIVTRRDCCDVTPRIQLRTLTLSGTDTEEQPPRSTYLGHAFRPVAQGLSSKRWAGRQTGRVWVARQIFFTGLAVGLRPCAGALFVLISALAYGVFLTGVFATLAMAAGVALTVVAIALAGLGVNRALTNRGRNGSIQRARRLLALSGAALILLFAGVQCFLLISGMANPSLS
ncbi:nickel/cobalt transporter [Paralcaligenes ginsengisoli]